MYFFFTENNDCSSWKASGEDNYPSLSTTVIAPINAIVPTVSLIADPFLPKCTELNVFIKSKGSGGRAMTTSVTFTTPVANPVFNTTAKVVIQNELNRQLSKSGEYFIIDGNLIESVPISYNFRVTVCNFLGKSWN